MLLLHYCYSYCLLSCYITVTLLLLLLLYYCYCLLLFYCLLYCYCYFYCHCYFYCYSYITVTVTECNSDTCERAGAAKLKLWFRFWSKLPLNHDPTQFLLQLRAGRKDEASQLYFTVGDVIPQSSSLFFLLCFCRSSRRGV